MQKVTSLEPGQYYHVYNRGVNRENLFREERNYAYFLKLYTRHITPVAETFAYCLLRNHFHFLIRIRYSIQTGAVFETAPVLSNLETAPVLSNLETAPVLSNLETAPVLSNSETAPVLSNSETAPVLSNLETASVLSNSETAPVSPALVSKAFNNFLATYAKAINKAYGRTGALFQHHFGRLPVSTDEYFAALVRYIHHNPRKHGFVSDFRAWPHSSYHALAQTRPAAGGASIPLARAAVLGWCGGARGFQDWHGVETDHRPIDPALDDDYD